MRKNTTGGAATVTRSMIRTCQAAKSATMFAAEPATGTKRAHLAHDVAYSMLIIMRANHGLL